MCRASTVSASTITINNNKGSFSQRSSSLANYQESCCFSYRGPAKENPILPETTRSQSSAAVTVVYTEKPPINLAHIAIQRNQQEETYSSVSAEKYHSMGYEARKKGDYKAAIAFYSRAIEISPKYFKAYFNRGFAYDKFTDYENAVKDYTMALELEPRNAFVYYNRGISLDKLDRYDEAIYNFTMAVELEPDKADFYHNRGFAYRKKLEYEKAILDYSKAIELSPDHFKVRSEL